MDVFQLKAGRYLLYLDILGFKQIVQTQPAPEVYKIVDAVIGEFLLRQSRLNVFKTLYFSDTIIFYQEPVGWGRWAFLDIYAIAGLAWSALAANGVPCRGAISFGEFFVDMDSQKQHSIFFGKALIEAYEAESAAANSDWIGVTICPSAWKAMEYIEEGLIDTFGSEGRWIRQDESLRLNPFMKLKSAYTDFLIGEIRGDLRGWDSPDFPSDVKALCFILKKAETLAASGDLSSRIARKYHITAEALTAMLGEECAAWAKKLGEQWLEQAQNPPGSCG